MAIKGTIDVIKNNQNYTTNSLNALKTEIVTLKQNINENIASINEKNNELLKNFNENMDSIKNIKNDFEKELFQFKLLKTQMQKQILEKFEEELGKELNIQSEKLKSDAESYNELKENISSISQKTNSLSEEMNKFIDISRNIKKEDFELTRFANKLMDMDKEKLVLMEKINTLERLVSKMRRQEYITR